MYCDNCGKEMQEWNAYCRHCGAAAPKRIIKEPSPIQNEQPCKEEERHCVKKYRIIALALLAISVAIYVYQLVLNLTNVILHGSQIDISTLVGLALNVASYTLLCMSISLKKANSGFLTGYIGCQIAACFLSLFNSIWAAFTYLDISWEFSHVMAVYYVVVALTEIAFLSLNIFLLVDALQRHKLLKGARIVVLIIVCLTFGLSLISIACDFMIGSYSTESAKLLRYLLIRVINAVPFRPLSLLVYYFRIASPLALPLGELARQSRD